MKAAVASALAIGLASGAEARQAGAGAPCPPALDVQSLTGDNRLLGVERAWKYYWITGAGREDLGSGPEHQRLYQFNLQWRLVAMYPQASDSPIWGGRDPEAMEDENVLLVGAEGGELIGYVFDPATERLDLSRTIIEHIAVPHTMHGLAYHAQRGTMFTKSFYSEIVEFDRVGGVLGSWPAGDFSAYGAAYDPVNETIWFNAYCDFLCGVGSYGDSRLIEWSPVTGTRTGREIPTSSAAFLPPWPTLPWIPGGLDTFMNGDQLVFVMLQQGDPSDFVMLALGDGRGGCPEVCYADCDISGDLDLFDFLCFQNAFAAGASYADCDGSGTFEFFDFLCFQNAFATGCR